MITPPRPASAEKDNVSSSMLYVSSAVQAPSSNERLTVYEPPLSMTAPNSSELRKFPPFEADQLYVKPSSKLELAVKITVVLIQSMTSKSAEMSTSKGSTKTSIVCDCMSPQKSVYVTVYTCVDGGVAIGSYAFGSLKKSVGVQVNGCDRSPPEINCVD